MSRRPGLTRVEALVGLVVAVLVTGLLLALFAKVRSSADQLKCSNNLKQFGLAIHNCHDTNDHFPPLTDQGDGSPTGRGIPSVLALLIPYLEATPFIFRPERPAAHYHAHSSVPFSFQHKDGTPGTEYGGMVNQVWSLFLDPADATADHLRDVPMTLPDGTNGYYATGSYAANGLAPWGTGTISKSFPRGTENTILMTERPQVCRTAAGEEVHNLWGVGFYSPQMPAFAALTPTDPPGLISTEQAAPVEPLPAEANDLRVRVGRRDASPEPPNFPTPVQRIRDGRPCDPRLPGGPHPAGMVVLMAVGSVRVFGWDTTPWVFWDASVTGVVRAE